jgi:LAO/AO transport system kinase
MWKELNEKVRQGDIRSLARAISGVENETEGYEEFLKNLETGNKNNIIGITGPPGAGKSTLTDALIRSFVKEGKKVAVICVDPSSPFHFGAILGDRIRMSSWHDEPLVYIRSLASRGHLGGLNPKVIEISDILKAAEFDYIIIETIGVGQNEVEISGLADVTVVVLVPESGDDIQAMKSGLMEIADVFVVNKADRPDANRFSQELIKMLEQHPREGRSVPVIQTVAKDQKGIEELKEITTRLLGTVQNNKKDWLRTEKAFQLIIKRRTSDIHKASLLEDIRSERDHFNLYRFIEKYTR